MKNISSKILTNNSILLMSILLSALILFMRVKLDGVILADSFHYGEYFATLNTMLYGDFYPYTIHGILDYAPAFFAYTFFGENNYFFHTWVFYIVLNIIAIVLFLSIVYMFIKSKNINTIFLLAIATVAPFLVNDRDIFLLISFALFFLIQHSNQNMRFFYEFIFGLTIFFSLFWAFDRGLATIISFGFVSLLYAYRHKMYIVSIITFFIILVLAHYLVPNLFSLVNYYENIKLLMETSSQWSYGFHKMPIINTVYVISYVVLILWLYVQSILKVNNPRNHIENSILFILLSLFLLKIGINRADLTHVLWAMWLPILPLCYIYYKKIEFHISKYLKYSLDIFFIISVLFTLLYIYQRNIVSIVFGLISISTLFINYPKMRFFIRSKLLPLVYLITTSLVLMSIYKGFEDNKYHWLSEIFNPQPNIASVTDGIKWSSKELVDSKANCIFDLSNNGVINGLAKLPTCTKFSYIVYANYSYEEDIINSLIQSNPPAVVYSSTYWSFTIDSKSMHKRFPKLKNFIVSKYPYQKCKYGYCIRYLSDPQL